MVRVIVAGQLPLEAHNAPLHLFSASPEFVGFGQGAYQQRSERTSRLLEQLFEQFQKEGFAMTYTMEDFERDYFRKRFAKLTPEERREVFRSLTSEERLETLKTLTSEERQEVLESLLEERLPGLSAKQIRDYLDNLTANRPNPTRKTRGKK